MRIKCLLLLDWKAFKLCGRRERLPCGAVFIQKKKTRIFYTDANLERLWTRATCLYSLKGAVDDQVLCGSVTIPLLYLQSIYVQHPSFHLLSLHASPAPSFILPSSISLFLYSGVILSIHSTLPRSVRGRLPVLTASYLTFSPLLWSNRRQSNTKSYRFTLPLAEGCACSRGWIHLQTSGHKGLVHLA